MTEKVIWSPTEGVEQIVVGIAHRGRLNLLTGILQYPATVMFQKMKGMPEFPSNVKFIGDVLSHLGNTFSIVHKNIRRLLL